MRTMWWTGAMVVGILSLAGVANAEGRGPCAADVQRLCGDVQGGRGAVFQCMKAHESELSPACQAKRAERQQKREAKKAELQQACGQDLQQFCSDIQPGGGRLMACLKAHGPQLSAQCQAEGQKLKAERREKRQAWRAAKEACRPDVQRLCADVQPGHGAIIACMKAHQNELSPECKSAAQNLRGAR